MRRYEKNFLLRKNMGYVDSTRSFFLKSKQRIQSLAERDPQSRVRCDKALELLDQYWESFDTVVRLEIKRGLSPAIGLVNDLILKGHQLDRAFYDAAPPGLLKELLGKELLAIEHLSQKYISQPDQRTGRDLKNELEQLERYIANHAQLEPEAKKTLTQAVVAYGQSLIKLGEVDAEKHQRDIEFVKAARDIEPVIIDLRQFYEAREARIALRVDRLTLLVQILTVGFVSLVVLWTAHSIGKPLRAIHRYADRVASGELTAVAETGFSGEFGELNANIAHMVDRLGSMLAALRVKEEDAVREAERANLAMEKAEAASRLKSDFLSLVSHELRTPLTVVYGFAKIIEKKLVSAIGPLVAADDKASKAFDQIRHNLGVILSEGEHLSITINNVLDLTEIESSAFEWRRDPVFLPEVIATAIETMASLIAHKKLELVCAIEPDLPPVRGDKDRLVQVVCNLLSNAVKFTEQGLLTVSCRAEGQEIVTCVADTGQGIPVGQQDQIFEKFTQLGDTLTNKPPGLGLGLAICKTIIKIHGGRIWIESEPGRGSKFLFALPVSAVDPLPQVATL